MQEKDGSVLEMKDNEVIVSHHMDFTNLGQHWYTYPDTQRRNTVTIVSRSGQKVLQPDSHYQSGFAGKDCIPEDEVQQWTLENGSFCIEEPFDVNKIYKVFPVIRNHFLIQFQSYYLTCDIQSKQLKLESVNKTMPFDKHLWILDIQQDGTFTMASSIDEKIILCNKNNAAVLGTSPNDDSHLWRREGYFIKSMKGSCYIGIHDPTLEYYGKETNSADATFQESNGDHAIPGHKNAVQVERLEISNYKVAMTKVMIQMFQFVHKETDFVLSTKDDTSEMFLQPRSSPIGNHLWMLDFQLDGTFLVISNSDKKHVMSCDSITGTLADSQLVTREFSGDKSQLWRFDGGHIESVAYEGQVISVVPTSQTSLCLSNKNVTQSLMCESFTPVYIRCLLNGTVLEVTDESDLKFNTVHEPLSDSQVWYLKYVNNYSSFMIISKKNGKAIQDFDKKAQITEMDTTNTCQHWKREGLYIVSQRKYEVEALKVMSWDGQHLDVCCTYEDGELTPDNSSYFEFRYFAAESYY